jgi:hypothetical protein
LRRRRARSQRLRNACARQLRRELLRLWERKWSEALERFFSPREQPVAQRQGCERVLAVVRGDRVEDRGIARLDVALVFDYRRPAVTDLGVAIKAEEYLHLLQPVRRHGRREPTPDDLQQIHEYPSGEQVVDLGFAGVVSTSEPPECADLVCGVVVDVHVGVLDQARVDPVDHPLESASLRSVVISPQRRERLVKVEQAPEILETSLLVPERVASISKKMSPGVGSGSRASPRSGSGSRTTNASLPVS